MLVIGLGLGAWAFPHDRVILDFIQGPSDPFYKLVPAAMSISIWGDYLTFSVPLVVALALYGILRNRRRWRRAALACLFGASLAGLFTDCFRLTLGRPRPNAHLVDGFYGIQFTTQSRFESFPSGHAATAMGTAVALLIAEPALGAVALLFAVAVCWSRMELDRHYPSDVIIGASIGIYFGLMAGWAAKTKRRSSPT